MIAGSKITFFLLPSCSSELEACRNQSLDCVLAGFVLLLQVLQVLMLFVLSRPQTWPDVLVEKDNEACNSDTVDDNLYSFWFWFHTKMK